MYAVYQYSKPSQSFCCLEAIFTCSPRAAEYCTKVLGATPSQDAPGVYIKETENGEKETYTVGVYNFE
jgi:hypothetical protein